jgi:hypothetical protein
MRVAIISGHPRRQWRGSRPADCLMSRSGVEIAVKRAPGRRVVDQLDGADLDDAMGAREPTNLAFPVTLIGLGQRLYQRRPSRSSASSGDDRQTRQADQNPDPSALRGHPNRCRLRQSAPCTRPCRVMPLHLLSYGGEALVICTPALYLNCLLLMGCVAFLLLIHDASSSSSLFASFKSGRSKPSVNRR